MRVIVVLSNAMHYTRDVQGMSTLEESGDVMTHDCRFFLGGQGVNFSGGNAKNPSFAILSLNLVKSS